ncbi:MAG: serine/threonine protein kinase, partial [Gammaproteobacteria bacterium]
MKPLPPDSSALKSDSFGRILLVRGPSGTFVRRDLSASPWWLRVPAWWLARREESALRQLDSMPTTPHPPDWES